LEELFGIALVMFMIVGAWGWLVIFFKVGPKAVLGFQKISVNASEAAVVYRAGFFHRVLRTGLHWVWPSPSRIVIVDLRPEVIHVTQGIVTSDRARIVLRCLARIQIADPRAAVENNQNYRDEVMASILSILKSMGPEWSSRGLHFQQDQFSKIILEQVVQNLAVIGVSCLSFELLDAEPAGQLPDLEDREMGFQSH
jgi:regulator of protease activity HflC (stomatin/prohibitin superfamily)